MQKHTHEQVMVYKNFVIRPKTSLYVRTHFVLIRQTQRIGVVSSLYVLLPANTGIDIKERSLSTQS